jgi:hypothetical protein
MSKELRFDATEVNTTTRGGYLDVTVITDYPNEVLNCFSAKELIEEYDYLDELYELLKEKFG